MATRKTFSPVVSIGAHADRPLATAGRIWWLSEDVDGGTLFRSDGTTWIPAAAGVTATGGGPVAAADVTVVSTTLVGVGTDAQAVFEELDNGIADHLADTTDAHAGTAITNTPAGAIAATTVQAAINELDTEKAAASHAHSGADITSGTVVDARIDSALARDSEVAAAYIAKTLADANSVLYAVTDDTPAALAMGASTILARLAAGNVVAATPAELRTLLALVPGTDVVAQNPALPTTLKVPSSAAIALTATEGYVGEDSTTHLMQFYDSQRQRILGHAGWAPYAFPVGYSNADTVNTDKSLPGSGGSIAIPISVPSQMLLQNIRLRNNDASLTRSIEWRLYVEYLNNGNSGENTLAEVAGANGTLTFTAAGGAVRTSTPGTPPIYLAPGTYWLVIRNTEVTNAFILSCSPTGTIQPNLMQTKTLGSALGSTLDFVAASWTKSGQSPAVLLQGRVFGQTSAF